MSTRADVIRGLLILNKYDPHDNSGMAAEHDKLWGAGADVKVSADDRRALIAMGWDYDPGMGWYKFL